MALTANLGSFSTGSRLNTQLLANGVNIGVRDVVPPGSAGQSVQPVFVPPAAAPTAQPVMTPPVAIQPVQPVIAPPIAALPVNLGPIMRPPILVPPIMLPPVQAPRPAATQLARAAIDQLTGASAATLTEATNAIKNSRLTGDGVIAYLERTVRIGEVLGNAAKDWSDQTKQDFAKAFQMQPDRVDTMDSIVSIAILNDRDLEAEIRAENTPQTQPGDLLQNRRVVWQYPNPGTVLTPPYLILIAVEYQDVATADQAVHAIFDQLDTRDGVKLPKAAIQKLQG